MITNLLPCLAPALCALVSCRKFARSASALSSSMTTEEQPVRRVDKTLGGGLAALSYARYDRAIKAAKQVLVASSFSTARIKICLLAIVRTSYGNYRVFGWQHRILNESHLIVVLVVPQSVNGSEVVVRIEHR